MILPADEPEEREVVAPQFRSMEENVRRIVEIDEEQKRLNEWADRLVKERAEVEQALLVQYADAGVQNVKALGRTVYLYRTVVVTVPQESMEEVAKVLDEHDVGGLARRVVHPARLRALFAEDEELWGERLKGLVRPYEAFFIRTRKAAS